MNSTSAYQQDVQICNAKTLSTNSRLSLEQMINVHPPSSTRYHWVSNDRVQGYGRCTQSHPKPLLPNRCGRCKMSCSESEPSESSLLQDAVCTTTMTEKNVQCALGFYSADLEDASCRGMDT
ncbi:hypothetical protein H2248_011469 [Termitomyces sp. 'cryptogamus']|nr:hypothetical protein H2248_011469 [Termitomyces sp. 'cryptogamus']